MLSDRTYMRNDYPQRGRTALTWLLSGIAAGFILEAVFERMFASGLFTQWLELSTDGVRHGLLWQVITYSFIHPLDDLLSVLTVAVNMLCLYVLGREMETLLGSRRFLILYFGAVLIGAFFWLGANFRWGGGVLTGAWPGILGCLTLYACLNPDQELKLLVMFALPVTIKPKYLVWFLFAVDLCGTVFWEIRGQALPLQYAPSAHLGGIVAGFLYYQLVHKREWRHPDGRTEVELPRWMRKARAAETPAAAYKVNLTSRDDLKGEVDRILDKINSQGFGSLTPEEKRLLDDARDQLSH